MRLQRRGGRKLIVTPEGAPRASPKPRRDEALVKAIVRAHRWRRRIESGQAKSITDLAEQEGVTDAYVCRLLPLTCLAPDILEVILDGRQPKGLRLAEMLVSVAFGRREQRQTGGSPATAARAEAHHPKCATPTTIAPPIQWTAGALLCALKSLCPDFANQRNPIVSSAALRSAGADSISARIGASCCAAIRWALMPHSCPSGES
jgi:hypothetical protein